MDNLSLRSMIVLHTGCLCLAGLIMYTDGLLSEQYIGCYNVSNQAVAEYSSSMTIDICITRCQMLNTTFAAIQGGQSCSCIVTLDTRLQSNQCNIPCIGNQSEFCGGRNSLYSVYTVCPIGLYGFGCNLSCHCQQQIPCDRNIGLCPNGECDGNWTGSSCNDYMISDVYLGCYDYRFFFWRFFDEQPYSGNLSIATCRSICAQEIDYFYFGLWGSQCFCGSEFFPDEQSDESGCNISCNGDLKETCGGERAISLFAVCPAGNYGENCSAKSNCFNNERFAPYGGGCTYGCKSGWSGISCNIRNCSRSNGDCDINQSCTQLDLRYTSVTRCTCSVGYQRARLWDACTDINECLLGEAVCNSSTSICINTIGSYRCKCKIGFTQIGSGLCTDIDECLDGKSMCDNATSNCTNTYGGYSCICQDGYEQSGDFSCERKSSFNRSGVIAGAVVGTLCAVTLIALLIGLFYWKRRKQVNQPNSSGSVVENSTDTQIYETFNQETREMKESEQVYAGLNASTRLPDPTKKEQTDRRPTGSHPMYDNRGVYPP